MSLKAMHVDQLCPVQLTRACGALEERLQPALFVGYVWDRVGCAQLLYMHSQRNDRDNVVQVFQTVDA